MVNIRNRKNISRLLASSVKLAAMSAAMSVVCAGSALAAAPGASLNKCQSAAAGETAKYIRSASRSLGKCLKSMSKGVLEEGDSADLAAWGTARPCMTALRRFVNSADPSRQLSGKLVSRLDEFCDPSANPDLAHTDADVWSTEASALGAGNLGAFCQSAGGDGNIRSYGQWRDCVKRSVECQARQLVASQWPRALEYLAALRPVIARQAAGAMRDDALAALDAIDKAIEGPHEDDKPEIACGLWGSSLRATGQTQCDQGDGTLGDCTAAPNDDDAKSRTGRGSHFVDNGDGTISDLDTGLMWEKLGDDDSDHDMDNCYWVRFLDLKPEFRLNPGRERFGVGFAGYTDWRLPTRAELETLVDAGRDSPAIDPVFNHDCTPGCTVTTCSCTNPAPFFTSTPDSSDPGFLAYWSVDFGDGSVVSSRDAFHVRGVRGGKTREVPKPYQPPVAFDRLVRNPWRSSCVPIQYRASDADSRSMTFVQWTLPSNGFITVYIAGQCNFIEPEPISGTTFENSAFQPPFGTSLPNDQWAATYCYIPFSPTFTGYDTFQYRVMDFEGNYSEPATVEIEIFEY